MLLASVARNDVTGGSGPSPGGVFERGARMCLEHAPALVARTPLIMNAGRHSWSDQQVVAIADVLDLIVVTDLIDVRSVMELAVDTNEHYLPVLQVLRVWTVHWANTSNTVRISVPKQWHIFFLHFQNAPAILL